MTDHRLDHLEASIRRLRAAVAVLGVLLVGVICMAAAPAAPADLKVRRLIASEVLLEEGKDKLSLWPGSLIVVGPEGRAELTFNSLRLKNANLEAVMTTSDTTGDVSVTTLDKTKMPSSVSLHLNAIPNQRQTPSVMVNDGEHQVSLLPTGLLPPPTR